MAFVPRATVGDLSGLTSLRKSIIVNIDGKLRIVKPKFFVFISFLISTFRLSQHTVDSRYLEPYIIRTSR